MIISFISLLPVDNEQVDAVDFGIATNAIPERDSIIEVEVMAEITNVSTDFNIVVSVLYFFYLFSYLLFLSLKHVINSPVLLIEILKLFTSFIFFPSLCSRSIFLYSSGADGYILSVFCSIYMKKN